MVPKSEKVTRYLKQVIVVDRSLSMPAGKLAAMVAHASMTWLIHRLVVDQKNESGFAPWLPAGDYNLHLSADEAQWLTELDPGIENQVSMAKIVVSCDGEKAMLDIEARAKAADLICHRVVDCGYAHNPAGTLACIAIGPHWPEQLEPVTGGLKVYR
ncbi:hypothetical protein AYO40_01155 [Planctomycetaceae bacterium SCGC AG-212-D15]|nr:hypothetical protein AYO40_01155 [Planctomycetaceae bacterium SCGC AG-212-D15]